MLHTLSAIELRDLFLSGECSAQEITNYFLDRIEKLNPKIGAFLTVLKERALKKAKELDEKKAKGEPLGKLAAIPIAIKDNIHIEGEISTCASKFLTNYRAPFNATVVCLLDAEDAILIGKTNLDEFAMGSSTEHSALQETHNPWNLKCTPGGSSGGSAAAVAARLCPIALGSDTGGSIRQPAAFCGVVGYKPTYGRVSRFGLVAFGSSLDQIGPFANNTRDAALVMEVLGKHCEKDSTSMPTPSDSYLDVMEEEQEITVGVPWEFLKDLSKETKTSFQASLDKFGVKMVEVDLSLQKYSVAVYYILANAEASTNLARFDGVRYGNRSDRAKSLDEVYDFSKQEGYGDEVKRRILMGTFVLSSGYRDAYYKKAQKVRALMIEQFKTAFQSCDVIAMPTSPFTAFETGSIQDPIQMYLQDIYTIGANLAGLPAISVPNGLNASGLPTGIQFVGPQKAGPKVFTVARAFEKVSSCENLQPPMVKE